MAEKTESWPAGEGAKTATRATWPTPELEISPPAQATAAVLASAPPAYLAYIDRLQVIATAASKSTSKIGNARTAEDALTIMLAGQELGISPMMALQTISVANGKIVIGAATMAALASRAGGTFEVEETDEYCKIKAIRPGRPDVVVTFGVVDAKRAKLDGKDTYRQYPRDMHYARAMARACRRQWPDILSGIYEQCEIEPAGEGAQPATGGGDSMTPPPKVVAAAVTPATAPAAVPQLPPPAAEMGEPLVDAMQGVFAKLQSPAATAVATEPASASAPSPAGEEDYPDADAPVTPATLIRLQQAWGGSPKVKDQWPYLLEKYGVKSASALKQVQAAELLATIAKLGN